MDQLYDYDGILVSDDEESVYQEVPGSFRRASSRSRHNVQYQAPPPPPPIIHSPSQRGRKLPAHLYGYNDTASVHTVEKEPENIYIHNHLNIPPTTRPRAHSQGAAPAPNIVFVREPSQTRYKTYRDKKKHHDGSSSDDSDRSSRRRHRKKEEAYLSLFKEKQRIKEETARLEAAIAAAQAPKKESYVDPAVAAQLAELKLLKEQQRLQAEAEREKLARTYVSPEIAASLAKLKLLEEEMKKPHISPEMAAKLQQLKDIEEEKAREAQKERLLSDYQESQRKKRQAEEDAIAKAEAARAKAAAEAEAQRDRLLASEREKLAAAAAKQKAETARILAEAKDKAAAEKAERERFAAEERYRIEKERKEAAEEKARILSEERIRLEKAKKEADEERARIMAEEKEKAAKAKAKAEEERKRILQEEKDRIAKEKQEYEELRLKVLADEKKKEEEAKAKKKAEDDAWKAKTKEQFMLAGFSPDYIEDVLEAKDRKASTSHGNKLAIELNRPTYIRVQVKHLLPQTLDAYQLPWEFDPHDSNFILIKEYISHDFQQELFRHTKQLYKTRDHNKLLGYTKETVTTLKPYYKDKETKETYLVRRKSTGKSPSRPKSNWFLT